jgi:hypothetical protein
MEPKITLEITQRQFESLCTYNEFFRDLENVNPTVEESKNPNSWLGSYTEWEWNGCKVTHYHREPKNHVWLELPGFETAIFLMLVND